MSTSFDDAHDAAELRLYEALRKLRVAEASGWSDYLVHSARREVLEANDALAAVRGAKQQAREQGEIQD